MAESAETGGVDRKKDLENLRKIGMQHFVMVMGAITLWGAADAWASTSGWALAHFVAVANAVIAGVVVTNTLHEWGHFSGARISGAVSPVLDEPVRHFFMFNFAMDQNDTRQFLWMSWGGILVPWLLVVLTMLLVPIDSPSRAMLLATFVGRAAAVSAFEVPVANRTLAGGDPSAELGRQLKAGWLDRARWVGIAATAVVFVALA